MTLVIVTIVLLLAGATVYLVGRLLGQPSPKEPDTTAAELAPVVKARAQLRAFKLLTQDDLDADAFKDKKGEELRKYEGRRLLDVVGKDGVVTEASVLPKSASAVLDDDPVTASIPATPSTTLGGRLRVGDVVELASAAGRAGADKPPGDAGGGAASAMNSVGELVVVGLLAAATAPDKTKPEAAAPTGSIILAFKRGHLGDFVKTVSGDSLMLVRPNP